MGEIGQARINFAGSEEKSASELGGAMPTVINAVVDSLGVVRRRPGIKAWSAFQVAASGSPVIGMRPFGEKLVYVTEDRKIHAVTAQGSAVELSDDGDPDTLLDGGERPSLMPGREMIVMAGAGAIQKWTGTGYSARLTNTGSGGDPPQTVFLCGVAQRLLAMLVGNSGEIWWTAPLEEYENWGMTSAEGGNFLQAYAKPDRLVAMYDNTNEVFAFGAETTQVYVPSDLAVDPYDTSNLLDFVCSRTANVGTLSPYSVTPFDDAFALVDSRKRVILTDAREYKDISRSIFQTLRDMSTVTDAWGVRLRYGRFDSIVWFFPSEGYGLIWDAQSGNWSEWRAWGDRGWSDVTITSAYNWAEKSVFLVGMSDGSIAQLDDATVTDLGDPIKVELISGFTNHNTMALKHCRWARFAFKRTFTALAAPEHGLTASGFIRISCRDNQGAWKILRNVELFDDPSPCITIRSVGVYRTRQWKIEYTGEDEFQLVAAQEEYETLGD
jgi:hypothetical protein